MTTDLEYSAQGEECADSQPSSCNSQADQELCASSNWTSSIWSTTSNLGLYHRNHYDPSAHDIEPYSLMHEHELPEEERSAVNVAINQLRCIWRDDPSSWDLTVSTEVLSQEVWDLLGDKEWRKSSIEGEY